ncbi:MAG: hypothetical protein HKN94_04855 [Acidimicrobiales bacterium]|nr:hypothetical protein [Acidimicrobiales bacterium]RZV45865.1 MAG: hypothetical protein EX269_08795 [Acidimicrobiales bacterium]
MGFLKDKLNAATTNAAPPASVDAAPPRSVEPPMPPSQKFLTHGDAHAFFGAVFAGAPDEAHVIFDRQETWDDKSFCIRTMSFMTGRRNRLDEWVLQRPKDPLARICRGAHGIGWAWDALSNARAEKATVEQHEEFFRRLNIADVDLVEAAIIDPASPLAWEQMITTARGLRIPRVEVDYRMSRMLGIAPLFGGHMEYLQYVCEKSSGSHEEMTEFALSVVDAVPKGSPLCAVAAVASLERLLLEDVADPTSELKTTTLHKSLIASAKKSVLHPEFLFETPDAAMAMMSFVVAFDRYGLHHLALPLLDRIGDRHTDFPMAYYWGAGESAWEQLQRSVTAKAPAAEANSFEAAF